MIDEKRIKKNLKKLSFPRLSGTKQEKKIYDIIRAEVEKLSINYHTQQFSFTKFYPKIYQKITFSLSLYFLLIFYFAVNLIFIVVNVFIILIIFIPLVILTRNPSEIRLGKKYNSNNIFLNFSNNNSLETTNDEKNLFLIAHLDSKGQTLPMLFRVINIRIWIYSLILSGIMIFLKNFFFTSIFIFRLVALIPLIFNIFSTIMVIFNFSTNNSPGAIDDATGVTILLELLHHLSEENINVKNFNLWFLFSGCEESGTMGIRNFHKKIANFNKEKTQFINFDSIGQQIDVWGPLNNSVREQAFYRKFKKLTKNEDLIFHFKPFIFATIRSDAYYLKTKGFRGYSFGDTSIYKHIHSKDDSIDKVSIKTLAKTCKIIENFLKVLDE